MDYKELQARQFKQIWKVNKQTFQKGEIYIDPHLDKIEQDNRRCLTSITRVSSKLKPKIQSVIEKLKRVAPNQYYYPTESLHLTIQNIRIVADPPAFSYEDTSKVKEAFSSVLDSYLGFNVELKGLNVFPNTVFIQGFTDKTLIDLRKELTLALERAGVPDDKKYPYKIGFGYVNIVRFKDPNVQALIKKVEEFRNFYFGTMKVDKIELVETDNYFLKPKTKVIVTFRLK